MKRHSSAVSKRNKLIVDHHGLVFSVIKGMNTKLPPGLSQEDLVSIGCMGLIDAAEKFDESKNVQFKTYAVSRIRGNILDELRRNSLGGQTLCRKAKALQKAIRKIESEKEGKAATDEEIAKELGISKDKLNHLLAEVAHSFLLSLDEVVGDKAESPEPLVNKIQDNQESISLRIEKKEAKRLLTEQLQGLPEQEKQVLVLYFYEGLNYKEIGLVLDISESRVSQIRSKAVARLRSRMTNYENM